MAHADLAPRVALIADKAYALSEAAEAMRHLEAGHVRGKVVITVGECVGSDRPIGSTVHVPGFRVAL